MRLLAALAALCLLVGPAVAQPDIPRTPHPRLLLDDKVKAAWKKLATTANSPVARAVDRCKQVGASPKDFGRDGYMGLDWAGYLQNCLVAWAATDNAKYADTAMTYFIAMIDDLSQVGDGAGGNEAARRDSGYSIRALGPYPALAYDWLHKHPRMTEEVKARARERFEAWTTWYLASGYRARSPSTNYHAGYLLAATFIAIAQNGEAGKYGNDLWRLVRDDLWGRDMKTAMEPGGVLDGGDWGEGWQYAPLSVASYSIAARAMTAAGSQPAGIRPWLDSVLVRHVHALSPGAGVFVNGDTQAETPNIAPNLLTLAAVVYGDASPDHQAWAAHEIQRLKLGDDAFARQFVIFAALAAANPVKPAPVPRETWPTYFIARGVGVMYARTHWTSDAVWTVLACNKTIDVDHVHPNAGNIAISRGSDDVIVDPSPYGTLSSLTSNAPTVESKQLPPDYKPSQAFWSLKTGFKWAHQTASGIVTARCDYADQYKFQDNPSDVPAAQRDVVVFPWDKGQNAVAIVVDRAQSGDPKRGLHLRFRTTSSLTAEVRGGGEGGGGGGGAEGDGSIGTPQGTLPRSARSGCCGAQATPGSPIAMAFVVLSWVVLRRRRRAA